MGKLLLVLMTVTMLFTLGCASKAPTAASAPAPEAKVAAEMVSDNSGLPEIAAYDDEAFEALPDMVAAGEM